MPRKYNKKERKAIASRLLAYKVDSCMSWPELAAKLEQLVGRHIEWRCLWMITRVGSATDKNIREIETFLSAVSKDAA